MTTIAAVLAGVAVPSVALAGAATAAPSQWETFHEGYGPEVSENFCGVPGFTVEQEGAVEGRFRITAHGPDGLPYYASHITDTSTETNVATGEYVTRVSKGPDLSLIHI